MVRFVVGGSLEWCGLWLAVTWSAKDWATKNESTASDNR